MSRPAACGWVTALAPGSLRTRAAKARAPAFGRVWRARKVAEDWSPGKSRRRTSSTCRAVELVGSTRASIWVNWMRRKGSPATIRTVAAASAIGAGRRITRRDSRYQAPAAAGRASRSAARWSHAGDIPLTRVPSSASTAGSTTSATVAASRATPAPPTPIE